MSGPDEDDVRAALDDRILEILDEHGDDGTIPRHTLFYFYGGDTAALTATAAAGGYTASPTHGKPGVVLECVMAVDETHLDPVVTRMLEWADQFGCEFDGWECQMLTH